MNEDQSRSHVEDGWRFYLLNPFILCYGQKNYPFLYGILSLLIEYVRDVLY